MRPRLTISFSGGRTSAVMTKLCVERFRESHDIAIVFANTGCEHEATLRFVDQCDRHFRWGVVWVEAVVNPEKGEGIRHKVVTFETASRKGEPFEADIAKHGMPGPGYTHCTRDLKEGPITSYLSSLGWEKGTYQTAIGIRSDEIDRISPRAKEFGFVYPLVKSGWTKETVNAEIASWPFNLEIKGDHYGNCVWCWKKSLRKLMTLAKEDESVFDFPKRMEAEHCRTFTGRADDERRFFFRGHRTCQDIIDASKKPFEPYRDSTQETLFNSPNYNVELDTGSACGESCEIGADD